MNIVLDQKMEEMIKKSHILFCLKNAKETESTFNTAWRDGFLTAVSLLWPCIETLKKISDPRLRDHKEPDQYTQLGCVMNIANEALKGIGELE